MNQYVECLEPLVWQQGRKVQASVALDLDALGQGQQVLRAQAHRHMCGIGPIRTDDGAIDLGNRPPSSRPADRGMRCDVN